jgi:hypothetical protein
MKVMIPLVKDIPSTNLEPVVMNRAIGGSKDSSPKTEKEEEEKHKQREKTAFVHLPLVSVIILTWRQRSTYPRSLRNFSGQGQERGDRLREDIGEDRRFG